MSIEFKGRFEETIPPGVVTDLLQRIAGLPGLEPIEAPCSTTLRLRFPEYQERDQWPEDVLIEFDEHECYVVFYTGSQSKQSNVITEIETLLTQVGISCEFEEL